MSLSISSAQRPRWTADSLDPYAAVSYRDVLPKAINSTQTRALAHLRSGRAAQAWSAFRALYQQDDGSPFHIWGIVLAADQAGRMKDAFEVIASRVRDIRMRELAQGMVGPPPPVPTKHMLAFNLGLAVENAREVRGRSFGPIAQRWSVALQEQPLPANETDRSTIILYSCAMQVLFNPGLSRPPLASLLTRHPNDAKLHYLMARLYSEGAVSMVERGKEIPVPVDQRPNPQLALRHALLAAKLEPNWADARYWAGLQLVGLKPESAKEQFRAYLKLATPTPKRKAMIDTFLKTGYWGPPKGGG